MTNKPENKTIEQIRNEIKTKYYGPIVNAPELCLMAFDCGVKIQEERTKKLVEAFKRATESLMFQADKFQYVYPSYAEHAWKAHKEADEALQEWGENEK